MKVKVRVEGFKDLEQALSHLNTPFRRKKAARDALKEAAEIIQAEAQSNAPVRTTEKTFGVSGTLVNTGGKRRHRVGGEVRKRRKGALRSYISIGTRLTRRAARGNVNKMPVEVYVGTRDRVGILTEFGTRFTAAGGWFRRAWSSTRGPALEIIKAALWRQIQAQVDKQARAIKRGRK